MIGRAPPLDSTRPVLQVTGLRKSFHRGLPPRRRTIEVLKGADLEIGAGELVGLVGENAWMVGSSPTTTITARSSPR